MPSARRGSRPTRPTTARRGGGAAVDVPRPPRPRLRPRAPSARRRSSGGSRSRRRWSGRSGCSGRSLPALLLLLLLRRRRRARSNRGSARWPRVTLGIGDARDAVRGQPVRSRARRAARVRRVRGRLERARGATPQLTRLAAGRGCWPASRSRPSTRSRSPARSSASTRCGRGAAAARLRVPRARAAPTPAASLLGVAAARCLQPLGVRVARRRSPTTTRSTCRAAPGTRSLGLNDGGFFGIGVPTRASRWSCCSRRAACSSSRRCSRWRIAGHRAALPPRPARRGARRSAPSRSRSSSTTPATGCRWAAARPARAS